MADLINSLDLNLLKVFRVLFQTQSTTRASEALNMSQSAVSRSLSKLRVSFNDPLFEWRGNSMRTTAVARMVQADIETALTGAERALSHAHRFDPETSRTIFMLGLTDYAIFALFPHLFQKIRNDAPHVSISLRNLGASDAMRRLSDGQIEFAIISQKINQADFSADELFCETYVIVGDPAFQQIPPGAVMPLGTYLTGTHTLCSYSGDRRGWVDETLERMGHSRNVQFVFEAFSPMIANLRGTDLLATVPLRLVPFAEETFGLSHWELPFSLDRLAFHLVMRRQHRLTPARAWFRKAILSLAEDSVGSPPPGR